MTVGPRFASALALAMELHGDQRRKTTEAPYVAHLLAVAATVLDERGTENEAIAALLHDALEDHPDRVDAHALEDRFGADVAAIVVACSDTLVHPKPPWRARKEAFLSVLRDASPSVVLVSLADKLHNATSLERELRRRGPAVFDDFNAGPDEQLWYHRTLVEIFRARRPGALTEDYARTVARIADLVTG